MEKFRSEVVPALGVQLGNNQSATNLHLARSIVYLATGNNDMTTPRSFLELEFLPLSSEKRAAYIDATKQSLLDTVSTQIQNLYDVGMRRFIIPQLMAIGCTPDLGMPPFVREPPFGGCLAPVNDTVVAFNKGLEDLLVKLFHEHAKNGRARLSGAVVMHPKIYDLSLEIGSKPADFGYQGKGPCLTKTSICENADLFIWFDDFHPSQKFYETMAHKI